MLKTIIKKTFALAGLRVTSLEGPPRRGFPAEFSDEDKVIFNYVRDNELSLVADESLFTTILACSHVAAHAIEGDFVECGVYRGGNAIAAADVFRRRAPGRAVWLFDTFAGMTAPTAVDVSVNGVSADAKFRLHQKDGHNEWQFASLDDVRRNFARASLHEANARYVKGDVLETLKAGPLPDRISVLRLDTDWYESTKLELELLYPRLARGGVLIVDDYGSWEGSRRAVEEYFALHPRPYLQVCDSTRVGVKVQ
jgi:O-methyltransferase